MYTVFVTTIETKLLSLSVSPLFPDSVYTFCTFFLKVYYYNFACLTCRVVDIILCHIRCWWLGGWINDFALCYKVLRVQNYIISRIVTRQLHRNIESLSTRPRFHLPVNSASACRICGSFLIQTSNKLIQVCNDTVM